MTGPGTRTAPSGVVFSVQMPYMATRPEQAVPFAALVQRLGAARLWVGQAKYVEQHHLFAHCAGLGLRVPAGIGVSVMAFRHPLDAAIQARSVALATGHPVVAGFGTGARGLQRSMLGSPYADPLAASREYAGIVRALVAGEKVDAQGTYVSYTGELTAVPSPPVAVGLGVLRTGMARVAGEVADVAVTLLTPASYLRNQVLPALRTGAEGASRPAPRLVAIVPVALTAPGRDPVELAASVHLRVPHYVDMLRRAGLVVDPADLRASARAAVDGGAFVAGSPQEVAEQLDAFRAAGVDEIVLSVTGVCLRHGPDAALRELEAIFTTALPEPAPPPAATAALVL